VNHGSINGCAADANDRWSTLALVKSFYGRDDCVNDVADIMFDRPVPVKVSLI